MKPTYIAVALVVLAGAGWLALERNARRSEIAGLDARASAASSAQEVRTKPSAYERSVPWIAREAPAAPAVKSSTNELEKDLPPTASDAKPPAMAPAAVRVQLDRVFREESVDQIWMTQAVTTARTRLSAILPETSRLRFIECRASMCRLETAHQDAESYRKFLVGAFHDPATRLWNGGGFSTPLPDRDEDGRVVTVAFLAREGQALPQVWQPE